MQQNIYRYCLIILIAIGLAILCLPVSASAKDTGTITLKDGTVFEGVTYKVNKYHKTIEFEVDEEKKAVSFTDIENIVSEDGEDITQAVLEGYYESEKKETWKSEMAEVHREARKKLWNVAFQLGGHYCFPLGNYYEGFASDFGLDGNAIVAITNKLGIRATVSKAGIKAEDDFGIEVWDYSGPVAAVTNYDISSWRYFISAQYNHRVDPKTPGKTEMFLFTGLGAVSNKVSADEIIYGETPEEDYVTRISYSETKFATTFGVGIVQLLSPTLGIYVGADMDVLYLGTSGDYDWGGTIDYAYQFDLKAGFTLLIK